MSRCELEVIEQTGSWSAFQAWKRQLLDAGPYWDLSGFGRLDRMDSPFLDVGHFWPAVGHTMLRKFLGEGCARCGELAATVREAGVWLDGTTIDAHLARQDAARMRPGIRMIGVSGWSERCCARGAAPGGHRVSARRPSVPDGGRPGPQDYSRISPAAPREAGPSRVTSTNPRVCQVSGARRRRWATLRSGIRN
jgi:hypothetical protein